MKLIINQDPVLRHSSPYTVAVDLQRERCGGAGTSPRVYIAGLAGGPLPWGFGDDSGLHSL